MNGSMHNSRQLFLLCCPPEVGAMLTDHREVQDRQAGVKAACLAVGPKQASARAAFREISILEKDLMNVWCSQACQM